MKLLMVSHSYVVALNRGLCRAVARAAGPEVEVSVVAPSFFQGDLRPIWLETDPDEPYDVTSVPTRLSRFPVFFRYGRKLRSLLRDQAWDVVHAWEEPYVLAGWQIARNVRRDSALVFSCFQNQPKRYPPPFAQIERDSLRRASGWTAFGRTVMENLETRPGYQDRPRRTIPLGVDTTVFQPDPEAGRQVRERLWGTADGPPVIGYLGRFVPEKGIAMLLRVLDRLDPGTWRAMFVGGGRLEPEVRAWAARHPEAVRLVSGVTHSDVPAYLNAMDLLAAPSQTLPRWKEQLGRMLLEAMACGVAVAGSDSGEIPYVLDDAGVVLPEAEESAWVSALGDLTQNPERRAEFARRGLDRVREAYSWPRIGEDFLSFFREVRESRLSSV